MGQGDPWSPQQYSYWNAIIGLGVAAERVIDTPFTADIRSVGECIITARPTFFVTEQ